MMMTEDNRQGPGGNQLVVAGVDGSESSLAAVRWAAEEASGRGAELVLVYATPYVGPQAPRAPHVPSGPEEGHARSVLSVAQAEAMRRAGPLRVSVELVPQAPIPALVRASERAALLVLGLTGTGGYDEVLLGSTTLAVSQRSHCPVAGIRRWPPARKPDGPTVVGVSSVADDAAAIEVAFQRARRHGRGLLVVHACQHRRLVPGRAGSDRAHECTPLEEELAGWRRRFPDVEVDIDIRADSPADALLAVPGDVEAIVTGTRRRGTLTRVLLGSTSHALLRRGMVPVIVVNPDLAFEPESSWLTEQSEADPHARSQLW